MEDWLWLNVLSRIVHISTAIVLVGGTVFTRFVLMPAADKLPGEAHESLRAATARGWKLFVHIGIVLFLASGFYNYTVVAAPNHKGDSLYHMLMGIKILLALVVFYLASVLVGRAAAFEKMRQNRKLWLGVVVLLAAVIVVISGFLKVRPAVHGATSQQEVQAMDTGLGAAHGVSAMKKPRTE